MYALNLYNYKDNIRKVSLTRFIKNKEGMFLGEAKHKVEQFLDGKSIVLNYTTLTNLKRDYVLIAGMGVISKIVYPTSKNCVLKKKIKKKSVSGKK